MSNGATDGDVLYAVRIVSKFQDQWHQRIFDLVTSEAATASKVKEATYGDARHTMRIVSIFFRTTASADF